MTATKIQWIRVSNHAPCGVCKKPDYCTRSTDGHVAHCMRVESDKAVESGGWIHKFDGVIATPLDMLNRTAKPPRIGPDECRKLASRMFNCDGAQSKRTLMSESLGVWSQSLYFLGVGVGHDPGGSEFSSFPSKDQNGRIIGIVRRYHDGTKKTYPGTTNGLFYTDTWNTLGSPVLIVEGASDVAACITAGVGAIGRPSNTGGMKYLVPLLRGCEHEIIVVGERDRKSPCRNLRCRGCSYCWPGQFGAKTVSEQLSGRLGRRIKWLLPPSPHKDVRAVLIAGAIDRWITDMRRNIR